MTHPSFLFLSLFSKSPVVSGTLLSILAVLNNVVVWMVSTRPLISKSSSLFNNSLVTVSKAPITIGIIVTLMFHSFFQFPSKFQVLILLFIFFQFYSVVSRNSPQFWKFSFCLDFNKVWSSAEIRWSVCMSKSHRSLCPILQDRCWVVHISFVRMVKFQFLAHLPVGHLVHPVVYSLILLLC